MDIVELGAIGELVGGVAVVATLLYLALQVRHSTRATESALYSETAESWRTVLEPVIEDTDFFIRGAESFSDLSESDALKFGMITHNIFAYFENFFRKHERGAFVDQEEWTRVQRIESFYLSRPGIAASWPDFRFLFTDSYALHVDTVLESLRAGRMDRPLPWVASGGSDVET